MKGSNNNIQFNYLHRDEGNYKVFGAMIFSNKKNLTLEEIEKAIREKLIDREFFYPKEWKVDLLDASHASEFFVGWYEFEDLSFSDKQESELSDICDLLFRIKRLKKSGLNFKVRPVFILDDEQPATCPFCSARTDFEDIIIENENVQYHICLDKACKFAFIGEQDD